MEVGDRAGRRGRAKRGLSGVAVLDGKRHSRRHHPCDSPHGQHHTAPSSFKHVAGGKARAVYQGKVTVAKGADGSDLQPERQGAAAGRDGGSRPEAGTGDLRRGRQMRPWRGRRRSGCGIAVLSARPRHSRKRSPRPAAPGLPGRRAGRKSPTTDVQRELVRTELVVVRWKAIGMTAAVQTSPLPLTSRRPARDFDILVAPGLWQAGWSISTAALRPRSRAWCWTPMREFAESEYANVHRGVHFLSGAATDRYEAARRTVQNSQVPPSEDEIVFTKGGTEAINSGRLQLSGAADSAGRRDRAVGDGASLQHRAVAFPARAPGAVLRWVDVRDDGSLDIEALDAAITGPDEAGCHHPYVERAGHHHAVEGDRRPRPCQGRAGAGRRLPRARCMKLVDVQALDIDFYAVTGHKLYGPHLGIGALSAKRAHLKAMRPFNGGGEMIRGSDERPHHLCRSAGAASKPVPRPSSKASGFGHGAGLSDRLWTAPRWRRMSMTCSAYAREQVRQLNWVRVIGDAPARAQSCLPRPRGCMPIDLATILGSGRRGGARGPPLRPGADGAVRRGLHQPAPVSRSTTLAPMWMP